MSDVDEKVPNPNDEAVLRMLAGAHFGPNAGVVLPSGRRLGADEAQALTGFYAPAVGDARPHEDVHAQRPSRIPTDRHSAIGAYLAGGGDLSTAPPRTLEILWLADESRRQRSAAPTPSPEPPASPTQRRRWWHRKP